MAATKGRPKGAKNVEHDQAVTTATRCDRCGSTKRTPYHRSITKNVNCTAPDGKPANRVTWRYTKCEDCGQHRIDKTYELLPDRK